MIELYPTSEVSGAPGGVHCCSVNQIRTISCCTYNFFHPPTQHLSEKVGGMQTSINVPLSNTRWIAELRYQGTQDG